MPRTDTRYVKRLTRRKSLIYLYDIQMLYSFNNWEYKFPPSHRAHMLRISNNLLFFLNWHYWCVKVSLNVYFWAPFFLFCIACESCLFVITNSWTRCLWWCIDFILKILKFSHISTSACLIYASSWKLKYVGRSNLALWTGLFWIKDE